jgi:amino acid transporter
MLLYVGIQTVTQGVLGAAIKGNTTPLASAAGAIWAPGMTLLLLTATVSMLGFLMGNLLGTSRLVYALGHDGHLPAVLGRVTERYRVPLGAVIAHGVIACSLAIYGDFDFLVKVSTGSNCLVYIAVSAAAWWLQHRGRSDDRTLNLPGGPLIPLLSALAMAAVFATLETSEWGAIAIALAVLFVAYGARRGLASGREA